LKALIFRFAKIYLQKSALMTAQRDLYLGNSPSKFGTNNHIFCHPLVYGHPDFFSSSTTDNKNTKYNHSNDKIVG